jgi:V/A-type H+-transporting ATPase subunit I
MIVPMKKVSLLILDRYRQESLLALRRLGLLHIKYLKPPSSPDIEFKESEIENLERALSIISKYPSGRREEKDIDKEGRDKQRIVSYINEIISLDTERKGNLKKEEDIESQISWYDDWGQFSLSNLKGLAKDGIYIRLYKCNRKQLEGLRKTRIIEVIKRQADIYYIAVVSLKDKEDIKLQETAPPKQDLEILKEELKIIENRISSIENLLMERTSYKGDLFNYLNELKKSLDFSRVKSSMQREAEIAYLQGFMPAGEVGKLIDLANRKRWAYLIQEPENLSEVPTLIENPRWLRIIEPVFRFMRTLPGYNEYDISFSFLLFFSLFFALLIGDAGYGLIFLTGTYLIRKKAPNSPPEPFILMYVLAFATIIWGAVSGTWFGAEKIAQLPIFKTIVIERVNSFIDINQSFMMYICFLIGAVHLTVAYGTIALRVINSLKALAQLGWILIIWSMFFVAGKLVLGKNLPGCAAVIFPLGVTLILLFSYPQRNMLRGIGVALGDLPLRVISSFSDVISYLRLFAVGYATVAVASSFNDMALRIGFNNILGGSISAIILFLGHGLNIILGLLAVIVHGIRLNMLEFSSHLGMQWSGIEYNPFKE